MRDGLHGMIVYLLIRNEQTVYEKSLFFENAEMDLCLLRSEISSPFSARCGINIEKDIIAFALVCNPRNRSHFSTLLLKQLGDHL